MTENLIAWAWAGAALVVVVAMVVIAYQSDRSARAVSRAIEAARIEPRIIAALEGGIANVPPETVAGILSHANLVAQVLSGALTLLGRPDAAAAVQSVNAFIGDVLDGKPAASPTPAELARMVQPPAPADG
jgi:hypothetical protein